MKQFVTLLIFILCSSIQMNAQTYLDHLKQKNPGQGVVTVHQSKAIDELVNGKQVPTYTNQVNPQDDKTKTTPQPQKKPTDTQHKEVTPAAQHKQTPDSHKQTPDSLKKAEPQHETAKEKQHGNNAQKAETHQEETEMPVVDMRKKVMRRSYKVTGYRVQIFAGGNSRNDRLKAEQTGNNIKMKFPDQPVYVHFYSPRWICRMGNFRELGEAKKVLAQGKSKINGPHQGGWVHTKYGEDWFMHFQDKEAYGRVVHLQPVTWKDNWPVMGKVPAKGYCGEPYETYKMPKAAVHVNVNPVESDEFNETKLGLQWQWHANYQQWYGMPTSMGVMRVYTDKNDGTIWHTPNLLLQKTPADNFTVTTKLQLTAKDQNQMGGIIMMGLDYTALVVKRVGDEFQLQQITCKSADKGKPETVKVLDTLKPSLVDEIDYQPAIHEQAYMRMVVRQGKMQFYFSQNGKSYKKVGDEFTMREGKWIGAKVGLLAKEPEGKTNRGWIDVDWFRITK